jgi:DNA polymerase-1
LAQTVPDKFVIIDGSSYFFRAFFAIRGLRTSKGFPTNAIKGFTTMLKKVLRRFPAPYMAMVFDAAERTFRNDLYVEYKAHRQPMPEELSKQIPYMKEISKAFRIPTFELDGFEADDIIATLARHAASQGLEAVVVTADKDLMQIVTKKATDEKTPGVVLFDESKDRRVGIDEVVEKFGVGPERVVDILALMGDAVDNIPGVRGIGEKTAAALVSKHGPVEEMLAHPERIERDKLRETLVAEKENALLSKKLARLEANLPIDLDMNKYRPGAADREKLASMFRELELIGELREIEGGAGEKRQGFAAGAYELIQEEKDLDRWLKGPGPVAIDIYSSGPDPRRGRVVGIAIARAPGRAAYIPLSHAANLGGPKQLDRAVVLSRLKPLLEDASIRKILHDVKNDLQLLKPEGITIADPIDDPMLASYLINADQLNHELEKLVSDCLAHDLSKLSDLTGTGKKKVDLDQVEIERVKTCAGERVDALLQVQAILDKRLAEADAVAIYRDIELPLARVLAEVESAGVKIHVPFLHKIGTEFEGKMKQYEKEAFAIAGVEFNLNSPKQLADVLFSKLKLPVVKKGDSGPSTDHEVLEELSAKHPLPAKILQYRSLSKLKGTYVDALPELVNRETGRVHTSFNQAVAATGRLSSSDPNLQNIPIRTEEGRRIRQAFIAEPGHVLVIADYSQIELRLLAHMSQDPILLKAFRDGKDVHAQTASEVFEVMPEMVTSDMRRMAKVVNFGIIYGMSAHGLSQRLGIPMPEARRYIERYFTRYQGVRKFLDGILAGAREKGYVVTEFGRRRQTPGVDSKNGTIRAQAERIAINAPVQGTAADVIKIAMIRLHPKLEPFQARMILQVHDELIVEAPESKADEVGRLLQSEMENVKPFRVPLSVELGIGKTWGDAKP